MANAELRIDVSDDLHDEIVATLKPQLDRIEQKLDMLLARSGGYAPYTQPSPGFPVPNVICRTGSGDQLQQAKTNLGDVQQ